MTPSTEHTSSQPTGVHLPSGGGFSHSTYAVADRTDRMERPDGGGRLIINADDWGRDRETTDRIAECVNLGTVSSASGMVLMEDSERAAELALESNIDVGLHLNFTTPFSSQACPAWLVERQYELSEYLRRHPFRRVFYHPRLARAFEDLVAAQLDEFRRLYHRAPDRLDGHHHMHLCANVLFGGLLPNGTMVRRNFSFLPGEKSLMNRLYRKSMDRVLARKHRVVDLFFSLPPLQPASRLQRIFSLASHFVIEIETHPINPEEYRYLTQGEILSQTRDVPISARFDSSYAPCRVKI
jgi:chitin disaccharide deacetylase